MHSTSSAQELRRRVENRRKAHSKQLHSYGSLPQLLQAKQQVGRVKLRLVDSELECKISQHLCERQFGVEDKLRVLQSDLAATTRTVQERQYAVHNLEHRLMALSTSLQEPAASRNWTVNKLARLERARIQQIQMNGPNASTLPSIYPKLEQDNSSIYDERGKDRAGETHAKRNFLPQPPRNLHVPSKGTTHNSIMFKWEVPIFTKTQTIIDYELQFSFTPDDDGLTVESTARWCLKQPVARNRFKLTGLQAGCTYYHIALRTVASDGASTLSNVIESIQTLPAAPPTRPLFIKRGQVTATSITLHWKTPFDDGGSEIKDYEITFLQAHSGKGTLDAPEMMYDTRHTRTGSATLSFELSELKPGTEYKNFRVRAVNAAEIFGDYSSSIASISTLVPRHESHLLDELDAAVNSQANTMDSNLLTGFMQRYDRPHFIILLSNLILRVHPKWEAKVTAILHREQSEKRLESQIHTIAKVTKKQFDELSLNEQLVERRQKFEYRITKLKALLQDASYNVQWCQDRLLDLVALIRSAESRSMEKQAELERVQTFRGPQVDSDVFEHGRQRFERRQLIDALIDEIEIERLYIVDAKAEIVTVQNLLIGDKKRQEKLLVQLQEREEALAKFEKDPHPPPIDTLGIASFIQRIRLASVFRAFQAWVEHRDRRKYIRAKVTPALKRYVNRYLHTGFQRWKAFSKQLDPKGGGIGTHKLAQIVHERTDMIYQVHDVLQEIQTTASNMQALVYTSDGTRKQTTGSSIYEQPFQRLIREADARFEVGDVTNALMKYRYLLSDDTCLAEMDTKVYVQVLLNAGKAFYSQKQLDQAFIMFNRAENASQEADEEDIGWALYHQGRVYFAQNSYKKSLEKYEKAMAQFEACDSVPGQVATHRGMADVYNALEEADMEARSKVFADNLEHAIQLKLADANEHLARLQKQLVGAGAVPALEIRLERVGPAVPKLRQERIKLQFHIREEQMRIESLSKLRKEKELVLKQGEADLKRALASDSAQVDSTIINGSTVRYEVQDFKKKLGKLMGSVKVGGEMIERDIVNARVRIRNHQDSIEEYEMELKVETGTLMKRMRAKESLRCFQFNYINQALRNVVGMASHGSSICAMSAGSTVYLYDLLTGACLSQGLGDHRPQPLGPRVGHAKEITSLCCYGNRIYSGSVEPKVGVWDIMDGVIGGSFLKLVKLLDDFDATVVCIAADDNWFACGCSDQDVFIYDAISCRLLSRLISAHEGSVLSIIVNSIMNSITTGGADHCVKVWSIADAVGKNRRRSGKAIHSLQYRNKADDRLEMAHRDAITCIRQAGSEIVSGDSAGVLCIWNLEMHHKFLRACPSHTCAITCLQFDATCIVSGGVNGSLCVTDFATGQLLQTLSIGDSNVPSVIDVQLDHQRIFTAMSDGCLRLWYWQIQTSLGSDKKKYHLLGPGETLKSLSMRYRTSTKQLMEWNGINDISKLYLGQKLVVAIDSAGSNADELSKLDTKVDELFGKLSLGDFDFVAANKLRTRDADSQRASQLLTTMASAYFPPLDSGDEGDESEEESEEDVEEEEEEEEEAE